MTDVNLAGKKIILIAPVFFGYQKKIKAELEAMGAQVFFHGDRPSERISVKALSRLFPKLIWKYSDTVFTRWMTEHTIKNCDYVFVIKGESVSPSLIMKLRLLNPHAKFIHYQWDSLANVKHAESKLYLFDHVSSFDPGDCARLPFMDYQPTFFCDEDRTSRSNLSDGWVLFVGTINGDRPRALANILRTTDGRINFDYSLFARSRIELAIRRLTDRSFRVIDSGRIVFKPVTGEEIHRRLKRCVAVLDIQHEKQSGLTLRTFEALAAGKKLITTNSEIAKHGFFDPSIICIIDRQNPEIPEDFLKPCTHEMPDVFFLHYSLRGWLERIFQKIQ